MRAPSETDLLALWECGLVRHPIDRALLLCAWARPELPPDQLADLPLGSVNATLLRLRAVCFGPGIAAYTDCSACGERLALALDVEELLAGAGPGDPQARVQIGGQIGSLHLRAPNSRDLAAVAGERDPQSAALRLLDRCCDRTDGMPEVADRLPDLVREVEAGLEALDPAADLALAVTCDACGHGWVASLDIGSLLWDEIAARARALLLEVHDLARAYGWSEPEILALSPQRRAAYRGLVGA